MRYFIKKQWGLISNVKGGMALVFPIVLFGMLIFSVWILEIGKYFVYDTEIQTATDAASLGAAMSGTTVIYKQNTQQLVRVVNDNLARPEAKKLLLANQGNDLDEDWEGRVKANTAPPHHEKYYVEAKTKKYASPIAKWLGLNGLSAQAKSEAEVFAGIKTP